MSIAVSIISALLVLTILVVLHEGGHFFMGKWLGFKINEFAVGMGPKLWSKEKNGTVYSLRAFPIGGMCAFEGEDDESDEKVEGAFNSMPAWKRFLVAFAGPFMNFVAAIVFAIVLLAIFGQTQYVQSEYPMLSTVEANKPAAVAGLVGGELVTAVNGEKVTSVDDMIAKIKADTDGEITLTVQKPGDISRYAINGIEVAADTDFEKFIDENDAFSYTLQIIDPIVEDVTITDCFDEKAGYSRIGVSVASDVFGYEKKYNILTAIPAGFDYMGDIAMQMFKFFGNLFKGQVKMNDVSGIVGVVDVVNEGVSTVIEEQTINTGKKIAIIIEFMFYLAALLSLNLAIMNLLPLPALDGGRIVFNIIEMIAGKAIPAKVEGWIHTVGLFLLLGLIVLITVKDVFFLFK